MDALTVNSAPDIVRQAAGAAFAEKPVQQNVKVVPVQQAPVSAEQAQEAVASANEVAQGFKSNVEFTVDDDTGINVVKVVDKESSEVIRQLPVEAVITFARTQSSHKGLLFKQDA